MGTITNKDNYQDIRVWQLDAIAADSGVMQRRASERRSQ